MTARWQDLSLFYRSLGQMLQSGVSVLRALESAGRATRIKTQEISGQISAGATLAEALAASRILFPPQHIKLIAVAERTGRLDFVFANLADHVDQLMAMRRRLIAGLLLPGLTLHAAAFIIPLPTLVLGGGVLPYAIASVGFLALFWGAVGVGFVFWKTANATTRDRLVRPLPVIGKTWRELDYWRITSSMEMLINAGLGVIEALRLCAAICHSPRIGRALQQAADVTEHSGSSPAQALSETGEFPAEFLAMWSSGEESGRLDDMLKRLADRFSERCHRRIQETSKWIPRIVYGLVMVYLVVNIFRLAMNYVNLIGSIE